MLWVDTFGFVTHLGLSFHMITDPVKEMPRIKGADHNAEHHKKLKVMDFSEYLYPLL